MTSRMKELASAWLIVAAVGIGLVVFSPALVSSPPSSDELATVRLSPSSLPHSDRWRPDPVLAGLPDSALAEAMDSEPEETPVWSRGLMSARPTATLQSSVDGIEICAVDAALIDTPTTYVE
ncbi:MAG: hypothetical protein WD673_08010 [Alphaproteobacteria bacterium]